MLCVYSYLSFLPQIIIAKKRGLCTKELLAAALHAESARTSWLAPEEVS